jgi:ABC-type uncharacterized transport system ATPase subunit
MMIIDYGKVLYNGKLGLLRQQFGEKRQLVVGFMENCEDIPVDKAKLKSGKGTAPPPDSPNRNYQLPN